MRKGFTLIELQAVIILMGIIIVISMPSIVEQMRKSELKLRTMIEDTIFTGAKSYIINHPDEYRLLSERTYCITLQELIDAGEVPSTIFKGKVGNEYDLNDSVEIVIVTKDEFSYEIKSTCIGYVP